ncbi:MAG: toxin-antitoxin system HicB family antitoxin [Sulfuricella sp.]
MSNYALRVPESLFAFARKVAEEEHVSMNQFFVTAIAEKVSALKTETYFRERQARGDLAGFDTWLAASPDTVPDDGDEIPSALDHV